MLICHGESRSFKEMQKQNYNKAKSKLERKINAIKMLIKDAKISDRQRGELKRYAELFINEQ